MYVSSLFPKEVKRTSPKVLYVHQRPGNLDKVIFDHPCSESEGNMEPLYSFYFQLPNTSECEVRLALPKVLPWTTLYFMQWSAVTLPLPPSSPTPPIWCQGPGQAHSRMPLSWLLLLPLGVWHRLPWFIWHNLTIYGPILIISRSCLWEAGCTYTWQMRWSGRTLWRQREGLHLI